MFHVAAHVLILVGQCSSHRLTHETLLHELSHQVNTHTHNTHTHTTQGKQRQQRELERGALIQDSLPYQDKRPYTMQYQAYSLAYLCSHWKTHQTLSSL